MAALYARGTAAEGVVSGVPLPAAGPGAMCSRELTRGDIAVMLAREVVRWLDPDLPPGERDGLVLAQHVVHEVRWVGTTALDPRLLADLDAIRQRHRTHDPVLDAFLDCVLAKQDGVYWNRTYLCLPVLEHFVEGPSAPLDPVALSALLAADIVRHELCASRRETAVSPVSRPDGRTLRTRVRHAMRFMAANLGAPAAVDLLAEVAHEPESGLPDLLGHLPVAPARWAADWLAVTALPVSTVHDETFFIRALQAHEMAFTGCARRIGLATAALRAGLPATATDLVAQTTALVERGASLFRMVATMRYEAFHTFRDFTEGASAIQSEQYKRFEAHCATPAPIRLHSPAFAGVPAVWDEVSSGQDALAEAYADARAGRPVDHDLDLLVARLADLEVAHRRWKATHLTLATRMLGTSRGSGYTAGVPYLRAWLEHPLFGSLPEVVALAAVTGRRRDHGHPTRPPDPAMG